MSPRLRPTGAEWLVTGPLLLLSILFALFGALQIAGAAYFLIKGHPAWVVPDQQPQEELSFSIGGWLPLGGAGVLMLLLAWGVIHVRRRLSGA